MKKLFESYGGVIVTVIAVVALITMVTVLTNENGGLNTAFKTIIQEFSDKTSSMINAGGENNGETAQIFDKSAPGALSFRSEEPLSGSLSVQVNGETVDSSHYTLTDGDTVVTLSAEYLGTLPEGSYTLSIVAENKSVTRTFRVVGTPGEENGGSGELPASGVDSATREITDTWEQIEMAIDEGVYNTRYQVGDTKTLNHATLGEIVMQIVAFDRDIKGDGSGNAAITWISKDIITTRIMRDELDGSDNVWGSTDLYLWCQNQFFPGLPQDVRDSIVTVQKTSYDNWEIDTVVTNYARFWIPSLREVMGDDRAETSGVDYTDFFTDAESRIKYNANGEAAAWWLRSAGDQLQNMDSFWLVTEDGQTTYDWRHYEYGVVIGFCM